MEVAAIELHKENIAPLVGGRAARTLLAALDSSDAQKHVQQQVFETQLAVHGASIDTKLSIFVAYINWALQTHASGAAKGAGLLRLLERALQLTRDTSFKDDARLIRLWALYTQAIDDPTDIYRYLHACGIGHGNGLFYQHYALALENKRCLDDAGFVYQIGMNRNVSQMDELQAAFNAFELRRADREAQVQALDEVGTFETERRPLQSSAHTASVINPVVQQSQQQQSMPKLHIWVDTQSTQYAELFPTTQWENFGQLRQRTKENILPPTIGKPILASEQIRQRRLSPAQRIISVYKDVDSPTKTRPRKIRNGPLSVRKAEDTVPASKLEQKSKRPEVMMIDVKIYLDQGERSFEEHRALQYSGLAEQIDAHEELNPRQQQQHQQLSTPAVDRIQAWLLQTQTPTEKQDMTAIVETIEPLINTTHAHSSNSSPKNANIVTPSIPINLNINVKTRYSPPSLHLAATVSCVNVGEHKAPLQLQNDCTANFQEELKSLWHSDINATTDSVKLEAESAEEAVTSAVATLSLKGMVYVDDTELLTIPTTSSPIVPVIEDIAASQSNLDQPVKTRVQLSPPTHIDKNIENEEKGIDLPQYELNDRIQDDAARLLEKCIDLDEQIVIDFLELTALTKTAHLENVIRDVQNNTDSESEPNLELVDRILIGGLTILVENAIDYPKLYNGVLVDNNNTTTTMNNRQKRPGQWHQRRNVEIKVVEPPSLREVYMLYFLSQSVSLVDCCSYPSLFGYRSYHGKAHLVISKEHNMLLSHFSLKTCSVLGELAIALVMEKILKGVMVLHQNGIIHGSLSADSIGLRLATTTDTERVDVVFLNWEEALDTVKFPPESYYTHSRRSHCPFCNTGGRNFEHPKLFSYNIDYFGVADALHHMIFGTRLRLAAVSQDEYRLESRIPHALDTKLWTSLFDVLLRTSSKFNMATTRQQLESKVKTIDNWILGQGKLSAHRLVQKLGDMARAHNN